MTPKQTERLRKKIMTIRRTLAAEKRKFGCYDDGRGLRYLPTKYYIQLADYKGGLTYTRWFQKNFPDDCGFPDFLFEWTILLFKTGKRKDAEEKAFQTFCSNTYLFDHFFGKPIVPVEKWEGSNLEAPEFSTSIGYTSGQADLADFSTWLESWLSSPDFYARSTKFIEIQKRLLTEKDPETRRYLVLAATQLS